MNRGGKRHDRHTVHELGDFSAAQLRDMFAEPELALIVGGDALTEAQVAKAEAEAAAAAEKAKAAAKAAG
jgi:hypothetical protein